MSELIYNAERKLFYWLGSFEEKHLPERHGFEWNGMYHIWSTHNPYRALALAFTQQVRVDDTARQVLLPGARKVQQSCSASPTGPLPPSPDGLDYRTYQGAGIQYAAPLRRSYIADEPGLGKTIQAIGIANANNHRTLFIACPALLRLNWQREIGMWHINGAPAEVVLSTKDLELAHRTNTTVIASYDLLAKLDPRILLLLGPRWGLFVADESHYLKNLKARRTQVVLGAPATAEDPALPGLIELAPQATLLSGTPIENGPEEFHAQLSQFCPWVISGMNYWQYAHTFCQVDQITVKTVERKVKGKMVKFPVRKRRVHGARNTDELGMRLRANIMVRRLKSQVLTELPDKTYQMVVFPQTAQTARVVRKEAPFDAQEIVAAGGVCEDPALPDIRREMGVAKIPSVIEYVRNLLDQVDKVVLGTYHREVAAAMVDELQTYNPVAITGETSPKAKQNNVDRFQHDPTCRVFIGQLKAAGVGITLTASSHVVLVEPAWVPGVNSQFEDRCHRIGQKGNVTVHILVVEGSLDAKVLSSAARKQFDLDSVLDKAHHF